ncbi:hypothetical protein XENOCAPTIV_011773 [Xenoophorus captivus]|uniref:Uncharacterized protein n=1 Tax=Xenoophorus captivus TaxID=1517983 RepID=A0ABV0R055_9TELE
MALQGALRRSFMALQNQRAVWRSVLEECDPLMESLGNLGEQMRALSRVRVSDTPLRLYEDTADSLDLAVVTERSSLIPSLADMLEWLQDAERYYRQQYPSCSPLRVCVMLGFWFS